MHNYETIMIISSKITDEEVQKTISTIKELIEKNGELKTVEEWGKRKLAYPIQKQTEGYYVLIEFSSNSEFIDELERIYNITDEVIKHIVVKKD